MKFITILFFLLITSNINAQTYTTSALPIIREEDGSPSTRARILKFPNDTLIDNGDGSISIIGYISVPTSPTSTCTVGQWSITPGWYYGCVDTNTWQRVALVTWTPTESYLLLEDGGYLLLEDGGKIILE